MRMFGNTEQLCSLGTALLLARTVLATCAASAAVHAALRELSQLTLQVACLCCTTDVNAEAFAGPSSPAALAISTPGASTPGLAVNQPELDRLLAATVALVGQWAVQPRAQKATARRRAWRITQHPRYHPRSQPHSHSVLRICLHRPWDENDKHNTHPPHARATDVCLQHYLHTAT